MTDFNIEDISSIDSVDMMGGDGFFGLFKTNKQKPPSKPILSPQQQQIKKLQKLEDETRLARSTPINKVPTPLQRREIQNAKNKREIKIYKTTMANHMSAMNKKGHTGGSALVPDYYQKYLKYKAKYTALKNKQ
jgi:hypothetical protein